MAYANGSFVMDGPDVVGVTSTPFTWSMVALAGLAVVTMFGAVVAQFVAWIGPLVTTAQPADKTSFVIVLVMGLLSFGLIAMVLSLITGPPVVGFITLAGWAQIGTRGCSRPRRTSGLASPAGRSGMSTPPPSVAASRRCCKRWSGTSKT